MRKKKNKHMILWFRLAPRLAAVRMWSSKIAMPGQNFIEERHATAREVIGVRVGSLGETGWPTLSPFSVVAVPDKTPQHLITAVCSASFSTCFKAQIRALFRIDIRL